MHVSRRASVIGITAPGQGQNRTVLTLGYHLATTWLHLALGCHLATTGTHHPVVSPAAVGAWT